MSPYLIRLPSKDQIERLLPPFKFQRPVCFLFHEIGLFLISQMPGLRTFFLLQEAIEGPSQLYPRKRAACTPASGLDAIVLLVPFVLHVHSSAANLSPDNQPGYI